MAKKYKSYVGYTNKHPALTAFGVIFVVLVLALGVCALTGYFLGWYGNFNSKEALEEDTSDFESSLGGSDTDSSQDVLFSNDDDNSFSLSWYQIDEIEYDDYNVDPLASSAYVVTANLSGTVYDPRIDWYLTWVDSYSGSDSPYNFVSISYSSNFSHECVLSIIKNFNDNIYLVAYRTAYPDTYATCKLDCYKTYEYDHSEFSVSGTTLIDNYYWKASDGTLKGFDGGGVTSFSYSLYQISFDSASICSLLDSYGVLIKDRGAGLTYSVSSILTSFSFSWSSSNRWVFSYSDFCDDLGEALYKCLYNITFGGAYGGYTFYYNSSRCESGSDVSAMLQDLVISFEFSLGNGNYRYYWKDMGGTTYYSDYIDGYIISLSGDITGRSGSYHII